MAEAFRLEVQNRFDALATHDDPDVDPPVSIEATWAMFRNTLSESAAATIGRRRGRFKECWIQAATWDLIDQRRQLKTQRDQGGSDAQYRHADKLVKRSCRRDKRAWIEQKGEEAQEAADQNDM